MGKIGGLDAYFAEPKSTPKAGVMLIHDIHGWDKKNIRLVADKYADAGVRLVHPCIRELTYSRSCGWPRGMDVIQRSHQIPARTLTVLKPGRLSCRHCCNCT